MAMKKRKGLAGSPEYHALEMGVSRSAAVRYFKSATAAAKKGMCSTAFAQLSQAYSYAGAADSHASDARYSADHRLLDQVEEENTAKGVFKANCMKGGANISGLRRRRSRR